MKQSRLFVVGGLLSACLAASAWAHEDSVIDLEALETYVTAQAATPGLDKPTSKAWKALKKALNKHSRNKLTADLAKLAAVNNASNGKLVADAQLPLFLADALDAADQKLAVTPDGLAALIGQIRAQADRDKVLVLVVAGRDLHVAGRTEAEVALQIADWKKADGKFAKAASTARTIIKKKQHGQPLPQTRTAAAGRVYTVAGQGEPGFNGDGHTARNTDLYFVEECRFGPDGLLYILDWNNHMLRRREADGTITRVCGSGIPGDSEGAPMLTDLNHPSSLAFEPTGDGTLGKIYIAAWHNHKVKVFDPSGGVDPDHVGQPWVYTIAGTTQGGGVVNSVDTSGDGGLATTVKYNLLPGLVRLSVNTATGAAGDLLTCDAANATIRRIALSSPQTAPNLVGEQVVTGTITRVAGTLGQSANTGDDGQASACTLNFSKAQNAEPDGRMELSPDGKKLYVVCGQANCVRVIDLDTGVITRFAGAGTSGLAGDGGPAVAALLNRPSDIAIVGPGNASFPEGTVFISDSFNNVIRKVDPSGNISTYAGSTAGLGGPAIDDVAIGDVIFKHPAGLELDAQGNLYVCDRENSVVRVIAAPTPGTLVVPVAPYVIPESSKGGPPTTGATGTIATYAGRVPASEGLAADIIPNLGFNEDGQGALDTLLYWPQDVAVDASATSTANVHVVDWNNHRIRRIKNSDGTVETVLGSGLLGDTGGEGPSAKLNHPTDIAFHPLTGELWVAAWHTDKILRLDSSTNHLFYMAGRGRAFSGDGSPASVPASGFDPMPTPGVTVPTPTGMAQMNICVSVKFTSNGDWYVSDEGNQRIRKVDGATDIINTICGNGTQNYSGDGGPAASATISLPVGQAAQPAGRIAISEDNRWLYLCDTNNNRVRRIDLNDAQRTITTFAGNGTAGYSGDGGDAVDAQLNFPCDVDVDAAGNVYIADRDNQAIRKVDLTGNITTFAGGHEAGYGGDGYAAVDARLQKPCGLFVVRSGPTAGRVFIADTYNGLVRVVWE